MCTIYFGLVLLSQLGCILAKQRVINSKKFMKNASETVCNR